MVDRLGDGFYIEEELMEIRRKAVCDVGPNWDDKPSVRQIATYMLVKDGRPMNKVVMVPTEDMIETLNALQHSWGEVGLTVQLCDEGEETYGWYNKYAAIRLLMGKHKVDAKKFDDTLGSDMVYNNVPWLKEII